jgi:hypothetical protein
MDLKSTLGPFLGFIVVMNFLKHFKSASSIKNVKVDFCLNLK